MKVLIFLCQYKWSEVDNVGEEIQLTSQDEQFTTHVEVNEDAEFSDEPSPACRAVTRCVIGGGEYSYIRFCPTDFFCRQLTSQKKSIGQNRIII